MYRQGDVLIVPVKDVPKDLKEVPRDNGRVVLAYGEVTGHAHAIADEGVMLFATLDTPLPANGRLGNINGIVPDRFLKAEKGVRLYHEEHDPIDLPAGNYKVTIQREYSPEDIRNVAD